MERLSGIKLAKRKAGLKDPAFLIQLGMIIGKPDRVLADFTAPLEWHARNPH